MCVLAAVVFIFSFKDVYVFSIFLLFFIWAYMHCVP